MRERLKIITQKIAYRVGVEPGNFMGVCLAILSGFMLMILPFQCRNDKEMYDFNSATAVVTCA